MAIKLRRRKQNRQPNNPMHLSGREHTWIDDERAENQSTVTRRVIYIILVCVLILVILIASAVVTVTASSDQDNTVTALDSFALTTVEQDQISEYAQIFATGMLIYQYCEGEDVQMEGKNAALAVMATNTDAYQMIVDMDAGMEAIAYDDFIPVVTDPVMTDGTQSYAGTFTYELDGTAGQYTEEYPDGVIVDSGFHFTLEFELATDESTGDTTWVITSVEITRLSSWSG